MTELCVHTFSPFWGLPTTGPFALKLLAWLRYHTIPYRQIHEDRPSRGPYGKSPWITHDGLTLGDSDEIIRFLAQAHGLPDPTLCRTPAEVRNDALKLAFEERFHQVLEWEMFLHPAGYSGMQALVGALAPPIVGPIILRQMRRHFRGQLQARGVGRLPPDKIAQIGQRQLDGLALCLDDAGGWLGGDAPVLVDFACWGQIAPMVAWPMETPVAGHAKSLAPVVEWHGAILKRCFAPDIACADPEGRSPSVPA
ncbi:MAG: Glutathione S-transferase [Rhodobacteraceae bacterium HLUCCA12]|nr:MAG: Glutathione S-transferase [Rhodobacteraceae bacterium HLUCCA12]